MKITKGDWIVVDYTGWDPPKNGDWCGRIESSSGKKIYHGASSFHAIPRKADAELIADAGTVANDTGLMPSELLEQRDALLAACEHQRGIIKEYLAIIDEECQRCKHKCCNACRWDTYKQEAKTSLFYSKAAIAATK